MYIKAQKQQLQHLKANIKWKLTLYNNLISIIHPFDKNISIYYRFHIQLTGSFTSFCRYLDDNPI